MKTTYTTPAGDLYNPFLDTLRQPHVMIGGTTGSGKSVLENGLIWTALHRFPDDAEGGAQLILLDVKGVELLAYANLPHTLRYAYTLDESVEALRYALDITTSRFDRMRAKGLRKYEGSDVYVVIDEFADLMTSGRKRDIVPIIQRIAQIGRAAKVHIILCTQCPIAKVIPTEIKVNFDCVWALRTKSAQDSRNLMGRRGCEDLPMYGQAYYITPTEETLYNVRNCTDEDVSAIVAHWMNQKRTRKRPRLGFLGRMVAAMNG